MMIMNGRKFIAVLTGAMFFVMQFAAPVELRAQMAPLTNETNSPAPTISPSNVKTSSENIPNPNQAASVLSAPSQVIKLTAPHGDPIASLRDDKGKLLSVDSLRAMVLRGEKSQAEIVESMKKFVETVTYFYNMNPGGASVGENHAYDLNNDKVVDVTDVLTAIYNSSSAEGMFNPQVTAANFFSDWVDNSRDGVKVKLTVGGLHLDPTNTTVTLNIYDGKTLVKTMDATGQLKNWGQEIIVQGLPAGKKLGIEARITIVDPKGVIIAEGKNRQDFTTFGLTDIKIINGSISGKIAGWDPAVNAGTLTAPRAPGSGTQQEFYPRSILSVSYVQDPALRNLAGEKAYINPATGEFYYALKGPVYIDGKLNVGLRLQTLYGGTVNCSALNGCIYTTPTYKDAHQTGQTVTMANPVAVNEFYVQPVSNSSDVKFLAALSNVPAGAQVLLEYRKTTGSYKTITMTKGSNGAWVTGNISGFDLSTYTYYKIQIRQPQTPGSPQMVMTQEISQKGFMPNQLITALKGTQVGSLTSKSATVSVGYLSTPEMKFTTARVLIQKNGVWLAAGPLEIKTGTSSVVMNNLEPNTQYNCRVEVLTLAGYVSGPVIPFKTNPSPKVTAVTPAYQNLWTHTKGIVQLALTNTWEMKSVTVKIFQNGQQVNALGTKVIYFHEGQAISGWVGAYPMPADTNFTYDGLTPGVNYDVVVEMETIYSGQRSTATFPGALKSLPPPVFGAVNIQKTPGSSGSTLVNISATVSNVMKALYWQPNSGGTVYVYYQLRDGSTRASALTRSKANPDLFEGQLLLPAGAILTSLYAGTSSVYKWYSLWGR